MDRFANMAAFERRCIRSSFVALPRRTLQVRLGRAPRWRGASTLSVRRPLSEPDHSSFHVMDRFAIMAAFKRRCIRSGPDHYRCQEIGGVRRCTPNIEGERDSPDRGLR